MKIAVDFDGTCVDHRFPDVGPPAPHAVGDDGDPYDAAGRAWNGMRGRTAHHTTAAGELT